MHPSFLLFAVGTACGVFAGMDLPSPAGARLLLEREGTHVQIVARYEAPAGGPDSVRYTLDVVRQGQAGRSETHQGGTFAPHVGRADTLAITKVNVGTGDRLEVHLRLFAERRLLDEAHYDAVVSAVD